MVKYLQETQHLKFVFRGESPQVLKGWADADWGADSIARKSTGGILVRVFGNPVIWSCKKQGSVARASTYTEYIALADTVSEMLPVLGVFENLGISVSRPAPIYEDV